MGGPLTENFVVIIISLVLVAIAISLIGVFIFDLGDVFQSTEKVLCVSSATFRGRMFEPGVVRYVIERWGLSEEGSVVSRIPLICRHKVFNVTHDTKDRRITRYDREILENIPELKELDKDSDEYKSRLTYYRLVRLLRDESIDCAERYMHGNPIYPSSVGKNPALCSIVYYDLNTITYVGSRPIIKFDESEYGKHNYGCWGGDVTEDLKSFLKKYHSSCGGFLFPNVYSDSSEMSLSLGSWYSTSKYGTDGWKNPLDDNNIYEGWPVAESKSAPRCPTGTTLSAGGTDNLRINTLGTFSAQNLIEDLQEGRVLDISIKDERFFWCTINCFFTQTKAANAEYLCANFEFRDREGGVQYVLATLPNLRDPRLLPNSNGLLIDMVRGLGTNISDEEMLKASQEYFLTKTKEVSVLGEGNWFCSFLKSDPSEIFFERVTSSAQWVRRADHVVVTTTEIGNEERMWILGGHGKKEKNGERLNDVWYTSDGRTWVNQTEDAPWGGRAEHTAVVYKSEYLDEIETIWIMGGESDSGLKSDVWRWKDQQEEWVKVEESAAFGPIKGHTSVVFNDKMWVIGGENNNEEISNKVWRSSGVNWEEVTVVGEVFEPRSQHTSLVFNNKIWVIGGQKDENTYFNDVWYSEDGSNWIEATGSAEWGGRREHTSVVFDNYVWVIGGFVWKKGSSSDIWYSPDGKNWERATGSADWSDRARSKSSIFSNNIWFLGGYTFGESFSDVWVLHTGSILACPSKPILSGDTENSLEPFMSSDYDTRINNPGTLSSGVVHVGFLDHHDHWHNPVDKYTNMGGGALIGAGVGSAVPGLGTLIGAGIGAAIGYFVTPGPPKDAYDAQKKKPIEWGGDWVGVISTTGSNQKIIKPANDKILLVFDDESWELPGLGIPLDKS